MHLTITGKHINLTDAIKEHAESKASKLPKFYDSVMEVEVIIDGSDGSDFSAELVVRAGRNQTFVVTEKGEDIYACIDTAVHKMESQIRKQKEILRDNKHSGNIKEQGTI